MNYENINYGHQKSGFGLVFLHRINRGNATKFPIPKQIQGMHPYWMIRDITMYIQYRPSVPMQTVVCTVSTDSDFDAPTFILT